MCLNKMVRLISNAAVCCLLLQVSNVNAQVPVTTSTQQVPKQLLTGTVTDAASKKGVSGARVTVTGFSAAITDEKGAFSLNVPSYTDNIMVTAEGYGSKQIALKGRQSVSIALLDGSSPSFQENEVMPFSAIPKRELTAATSYYNPNGEWKRPMETIDALLQGQVAGLNSIRRSGTPGAGANMFLRGYNSLYGTNKPLVIVDGMIYDINDYGQSIIANH